LLVQSAERPEKVDALAALGRTLLDYTTFQILTQHIDAAVNADEKSLLTAVRERLLAINAEYEQQARAMIQRAADTLQSLLMAPDIPSTIQANLNRIDDTFLQVLQVNLEEARKADNADISNRLKIIRDEVLKLIQSSAPPEIQFINELLSLESEEESIGLLHSRGSEVNEELIHVMGDLAQQLRDGGNPVAAQRLELLRDESLQLIG
jgi:hypothetical protein